MSESFTTEGTEDHKRKTLRLKLLCDPHPRWFITLAGSKHYFFAVVFSPKICSSMLLATKTSPFATTGTRFELPPKFGQ